MIWPGDSQIINFDALSPGTALYNFRFESNFKRTLYNAIIAEAIWPKESRAAYLYSMPNSGIYFNNLQDLSGFETDPEFLSFAVKFDWSAYFDEYKTWAELNSVLISEKLKHNKDFLRIKINFMFRPSNK